MPSLLFGSVPDVDGEWSGAAGAAGNVGWIVDGAQLPPPRSPTAGAVPPGNCWTETRTYFAVGEFPLLISRSLAGLAPTVTGDIGDLIVWASRDVYRRHRDRHPPHLCPPAPGHATAAVSVSHDAVSWAVLGPCAILWRAPARTEDPPPPPPAGSAIDLAGWDGATDQRYSKAVEREHAAYVAALRSANRPITPLHEAYVHAALRRRGVPGGYSLLGTTGRLRPGDVVSGKLPAPCEVLVLSSALYRRFRDYAVPTATRTEFPDAETFVDELRADPPRTLLRARYDDDTAPPAGPAGTRGAYAALVASTAPRHAVKAPRGPAQHTSPRQRRQEPADQH